MARLTDGPLQVEALDIVKRRLLRQNREFARVNSAQCMRIQCLETEKSRLLAENIALQEENVQLRLSLEDSRSLAGQLQRDVSRVECRMRSQLQTLMGMSAELRGIADGEARLSVGRRSSASRRSSEEGQPKPSTLWLQEWQTAVQQQKNLASESEDWKLPTILEDKTYPRRTLNANDLLGTVTPRASSDSPLAEPEEEGEDLPALYPSNLETRKRRRDSSAKVEGRRMSVYGPPSGAEQDAPASEQSVVAETQIVVLDTPLVKEEGDMAASGSANPYPTLKAASKRKFNVRVEEETRTGPINQISDETFKFNRKAPKGENQSVRLVPKKAGLSAAVSPHKSPERRKALGAKCVNTDPVSSPMKKTQQPAELCSPMNVKSMIGAAPPKRGPGRKPKTTANREPVALPPASSLLQRSPEATAAVIALPSPAPSSPSPVRPLKSTDEWMGDTPAPTTPAFSTFSSTDSPEQQSRAGRRSTRGITVNYAEPSLIRKLRRPTDGMVDAVARGGRRGMSVGDVGDDGCLTGTSTVAIQAKKIDQHTKVREKSGRNDDDDDDDDNNDNHEAAIDLKDSSHTPSEITGNAGDTRDVPDNAEESALLGPDRQRHREQLDSRQSASRTTIAALVSAGRPGGTTTSSTAAAAFAQRKLQQENPRLHRDTDSSATTPGLKETAARSSTTTTKTLRIRRASSYSATTNSALSSAMTSYRPENKNEAAPAVSAVPSSSIALSSRARGSGRSSRSSSSFVSDASLASLAKAVASQSLELDDPALELEAADAAQSTANNEPVQDQRAGRRRSMMV